MGPLGLGVHERLRPVDVNAIHVAKELVSGPGERVRRGREDGLREKVFDESCRARAPWAWGVGTQSTDGNSAGSNRRVEARVGKFSVANGDVRLLAREAVGSKSLPRVEEASLLRRDSTVAQLTREGDPRSVWSVQQLLSHEPELVGEFRPKDWRRSAARHFRRPEDLRKFGAETPGRRPQCDSEAGHGRLLRIRISAGMRASNSSTGRASG